MEISLQGIGKFAVALWCMFLVVCAVLIISTFVGYSSSSIDKYSVRFVKTGMSYKNSVEICKIALDK